MSSLKPSTSSASAGNRARPHATPSEVSKQLAIFADFLTARGLRQTKARLTIARAALDYPGYFRAEDLRQDERVLGRRMVAPSIYRTLPLLVSAGLIRQVKNGGLYGVRSRDEASAAYVICSSCRCVTEISCAALEEFVRTLDEACAFSVNTVEASGRCRACRGSSE